MTTVDKNIPISQIAKQECERNTSIFGLALGHVPSWAISMLVHAAIILIMVFQTFTEEPINNNLLIVGGSEEQLEELVQFELTQDRQILELQELEIPNPVAALELTDFVSTIELGVDAQAEMGELDRENNITGDIAGLLGKADLGMSLRKGGDTGQATFFGVQTSGNRFVYVVDNSVSMNDGKFETAIDEIKKSVAELKPEHEFYVIFYSDTSYPMFYPEVQRSLVPATEANKKKLYQWLGKVHLCAETRGEAAMDLALRMRPDGLYLLGDGAFTDRAIFKTIAIAKDHNVTIHTLGFGMTSRDSLGFVRLAQAYNGTFQNVEVTAEMRAYSKTVNRPNDNRQNGVWGINLN